MLKSPIFYIVLAAFLIRICSVFFGLPHALVFGDEMTHTIAAFKLIDAKSLILTFAHDYYLPPLYAYLLMPVYGIIGLFGLVIGFFSNIADFKEFVILYREWFLAPSRVLAAMFGAGTVYLVYLFAKKLFDKKVALLSAFLLAFNFLHVHESQIGHIWSPIVFFAVLSAYSFYSLYLSGERKWYLLSMLGLGLGYAIGQIGIIFYPFFLLVHFLYVKKILRQSSGQAKSKFFDRKFVEANVWLVVILILFTVLNFFTFYKHLHDAVFPLAKLVGLENRLFENYPHLEVATQKSGGFSFLGNWLFMLKTLFFVFPIVFVAFFAGAAVLLKKFGKSVKNILLLGLPFYTLVIFSVIFYAMLCRYTMIVVPFMIIAVSYFIFWLWEKFSPNKNKIFLGVLIIIISFCSVLASVSYSYKLLKPYTISAGIDWFYENVPEGKRVVSSSIYLNKNKESVEFLKKYNVENWVDIRNALVLSIDDNKLPRPNYFVIETDLSDVYSLPESEQKADYALIFFYPKTGRHSEEERYAILDIFGERERIAYLYPKGEKQGMKNFFNLEPHFFLKNILEAKSLGPNVEIYKFNLP